MTSVPAIDVKELRRRLAAEPAPFLLDVREPWEYLAGHVPGAHLIPLGELEQRVSEVPRNREVLAICHSGQRSLAASEYLQQLGYPAVSNVDGGTSAWIERGYPTEGPSATRS
jgi:sulfur-carrier protein adenylyltransferase/sulfurtransferase